MSSAFLSAILWTLLKISFILFIPLGSLFVPSQLINNCSIVLDLNLKVKDILYKLGGGSLVDLKWDTRS